jgi:5,10-methylenetetrahydromethanopterin reductase
MMKINVSVGISPRQSLESWAEFAAELEKAGVDRIWLIDSQVSMKDVYVGLTLAALHTSHLELGTGVTNLVTRHPSVTANAVAAIAELSAGRAVLGLGAGDSAVYGIGKSPSKIADVEAALLFFRAVLSGGEGEWQDQKLGLAYPGQRVKIYVAASQERMCQLAGRLADGVILMGPAQVDIVARQIEWIRDGIRLSHREQSEVDVCFMATTSVSSDQAEAVNDVRAWATGQARLLADFKELPPSLLAFRQELAAAKRAYDYAEHLSTHAGHSQLISDDLVRTLAVAGSAEECARRLSGLLTAGVGTLIFPLMGGGRLERLRVLRERLVPLLDQGA